MYGKATHIITGAIKQGSTYADLYRFMGCTNNKPFTITTDSGAWLIMHHVVVVAVNMIPIGIDECQVNIILIDHDSAVHEHVDLMQIFEHINVMDYAYRRSDREIEQSEQEVKSLWENGCLLPETYAQAKIKLNSERAM